MSARPSTEKPQWVNLECECGSRGGQYLQHYQLCRCSCGQMFWALREKRDGPLKAYVWPGNAGMERARRERELPVA